MTDAAPGNAAPVKERYVGIDVLRFLVVFPIIAVHTLPSSRPYIDFVGVLDNIGRFIIPFFFIVSGYFIGKKNPTLVQTILGLTLRLAPLFLFWLFVYLALLGQLGNLTDPYFIVKCLYYGGPAFHLWFFPALGMSAALVVATRGLGWAGMAIFGLALYAVPVITYGYNNVLDLPKMPVALLTGPFGGFIFVLFGYYLGRTGIIPSLRTGVTLFVMGAVLQLTEAYFIFSTGNGAFSPHLYLVGTLFLGTGAFILSLYIKPFTGSSTLASLGKISVGMYCVHVVFIKALQPYYNKNDLAEVGFVILAVAALSVITALGISKIPVLKRFVQ
jgi:surface polysaccharide O-acyltransferase-like enzyme